MKTDDLIKALVADNASTKPPIGRTLAVSLLAGIVISCLVYTMTMTLRSDFFWSILHAPRFQFKFAFTLAVALPALLVARRLARPDAEPAGLASLLALPALVLLGGVAAEMMTQPAEHWAVYAKGSNSLICMAMIPLLAAGPLAAMLYALRQGAPSYPGWAGAAAGLLASGIGATLYASHCSDDSPLFVSIWYPAGIAIVTAAGALLGKRLLRW